MSISDEIFELLSKKDFQNPDSGMLFFPAYVYTYPPEKEFEVRKQIKILDDRLSRPNNSLNCLVVNIYKKFIDYLKTNSFAGKSYLERVLLMEKESPERVQNYLDQKVHGQEFIKLIGEEFDAYFKEQTADRVYLLLYGFGTVFPYLRLSEFLKNMEQYVKRYKLIAFYPGEFKDNNYSLFSVLDDDNIYRASHLNQLIY